MHAFTIAIAMSLMSVVVGDVEDDPLAWEIYFSMTDPLACELERFPPLLIAKENFNFGMAHGNYLEKQRNSGFCSAWYQENWSLNECWLFLDVAQDRSSSFARRVQALQNLKQWLGEENYFMGRMPPCVPIWRFRDGPPTFDYSPPTCNAG
ncbi:MAG: hypothetical protein ACJ8FY_28630 [Gemmataceae bacterium]